MTLKIISSESILFSGNVNLVNLPGTAGNFTILENHASLVSTLESGKVRYITSPAQETIEIPIKGGLVEVSNNIVSVCLF